MLKVTISKYQSWKTLLALLYITPSCKSVTAEWWLIYKPKHIVVDHHHHHHKPQGLDPLIRSVSRVITALTNVSSVFLKTLARAVITLEKERMKSYNCWSCIWNIFCVKLMFIDFFYVLTSIYLNSPPVS
jgi:hypothetical protein